jgi:glucokinase
VIEGRFIGIDVGGTKVAATALEGGKFSAPSVEPTVLSSTDNLVDQLVDAIQALRSPDTRAVGIGVPSIIEFATGRIRYSVNIPLRDVPLRTLLTQRLGVPVYVENDASCAALAEAYDGDRLRCPDLVMLTVGTGVGGGVVIGGKLHRGATGAAPEFGHIIVGLPMDEGAPPPAERFPQPGSLEALASGRALDRLALATGQRHPESPLGRILAIDGDVSGRDAVAAAAGGDPLARRCIHTLGERLGIGIAAAICLFDPREVVIGGGVSAAGDLLLSPAAAVARAYAVPGAGTATVVRLARHGSEAGVLGAALMAAQECAKDAA